MHDCFPRQTIISITVALISTVAFVPGLTVVILRGKCHVRALQSKRELIASLLDEYVEASHKLTNLLDKAPKHTVLYNDAAAAKEASAKDGECMQPYLICFLVLVRLLSLIVLYLIFRCRLGRTVTCSDKELAFTIEVQPVCILASGSKIMKMLPDTSRAVDARTQTLS